MPGTRKPAEKKQLLVAKDGFICSIKGEEHLIQQGRKLPSDHPVVKQHPELFEPAQEAAA
jgi:hypothetical protein